MKIIIGSESFAPNISGVATATELLACHLAKEGHEVWVFAPSRSRRTHQEESKNGFHIVRFGSVVNVLRQGFRVTLWPRRAIFRLVRQIKPDIIHLQDPTSIGSQLLKAGRKESVPVIVTNHFTLDYVVSYLRFLWPFQRQVRAWLRHYLTRFYNQCEYVICPTETVKTQLVKWGVNTRIVPISNGVDLNKFFVHQNIESTLFQFHLPPNPKVLYVGRVDRDKSVEVLIRAIPAVLAEINAHFIIVGEGEEMKKLQKLTGTLGVEEEISWLGWVTPESGDLAKLYQAADVFVMPSKIETQSIGTMEAMASGLPVVGAKGGALPELIKNNENGFLFRPDDSSDLAAKLVIILSDKALRESMREKSLLFVSEHQISNSFTKIKKIYEEVVAKKKLES